MELKERQIEATKKIQRMIDFGVMKRCIYENMSISFRTFEIRLIKNNWKLPELNYIENLKFE